MAMEEVVEWMAAEPKVEAGHQAAAAAVGVHRVGGGRTPE